MITAALVNEPYSDERCSAIADEFSREGCVVVPCVFSPDEVKLLREKTDTYFDNRESIPQQHVSYVHGAFVLRRGAELDPAFDEVVRCEPIQQLVTAVLGPYPRFNACNVIRNEPGQAINLWHVDDLLEHPLPDDIPRFDARIKMPVLWFTVQVALSDIDTIEHGPTQYLPKSHYSGRIPVSQDNPVFEGVGPKSVFCKAGDIYFTNHQTWHRGAPNTSDRIRYVMQLQYAARWADARFKGIA